MKRTARRLALRSDTLRALTATELGRAAGGFYTVSDLVCPATYQASCGDSCTADLRTT